jgi:hypothetical protein
VPLALKRHRIFKDAAVEIVCHPAATGCSRPMARALVARDPEMAGDRSLSALCSGQCDKSLITSPEQSVGVMVITITGAMQPRTRANIAARVNMTALFREPRARVNGTTYTPTRFPANRTD